MPQPKLHEIQAWLHTFVVQPGEQEAALRAAEEKAGLKAGSADDLVLPSPTLTPQERLQIYRGMYLLRMQEALEIDFPAARWYLGDARFESLVASYVHRYPSRSYTLDHLGKHFATFLREEISEAVSELAALEWSLCMVAIAHDAPSLSMTDLAGIPEERFLDLRFQPVHALELHQFEYNANTVYKCWNNGSPQISLQAESCNLVCWRHELKVWRLELSDSAFHFLTGLCQGKSLGESLGETIEEYQETEEQLFEWFQSWVLEGFFQGLETGPAGVFGPPL